MSNVGSRIFTEINRPSQSLVEQFRDIPVANINDCMGRLFCVDGRIRSINGKHLLGVALTIHTVSGDNLFMHRALSELAQPGDVIVVAGGGDERSFCGELMMKTAKNKGLAGFAIDGCIRDYEETCAMDFPVFAKGITPQGPYKNGPGEINVPVAFGGQVAFPGDIVIGDQDGMIFLRPHEAERILELAKEYHREEDELNEALDAGDAGPSLDPDFVQAGLDRAKCEVISGVWTDGQ